MSGMVARDASNEPLRPARKGSAASIPVRGAFVACLAALFGGAVWLAITATRPTPVVGRTRNLRLIGIDRPFPAGGRYASDPYIGSRVCGDCHPGESASTRDPDTPGPCSPPVVGSWPGISTAVRSLIPTFRARPGTIVMRTSSSSSSPDTRPRRGMRRGVCLRFGAPRHDVRQPDRPLGPLDPGAPDHSLRPRGCAGPDPRPRDEATAAGDDAAGRRAAVEGCPHLLRLPRDAALGQRRLPDRRGDDARQCYRRTGHGPGRARRGGAPGRPRERVAAPDGLGQPLGRRAAVPAASAIAIPPGLGRCGSAGGPEPRPLPADRPDAIGLLSQEPGGVELSDLPRPSRLCLSGSGGL